MSHLDQDLQLKDDKIQIEFIRKACEEIQKNNRQDPLLQKPAFNVDLSGMVIVSNLPSVTEDKLPKLKVALNGLLKKQDLVLERDASLSMKGVALLQFATADLAQKGAKALNGFPFDKKLRLQAYTHREFCAIQQTQEDYKRLNLKTNKELLSFLTDKNTQLVTVQENTRFTCLGFDPIEREVRTLLQSNIPAYLKMIWSPSGAYQVLIFDYGFQFYGGDKFELLHEFHHQGVIDISFSKDESYCISFNGATSKKDNYIVWNIREERKLREFTASQSDELSTYQFSPNSNFISRITQDEIVLLQAPDFFLWETLPLKNVQQAVWIPGTDFLCTAYYACANRSQANQKDSKKGILLYSIPSKQTYSWKQLNQDTESIELIPHSQGKWVCAVLHLKQKNKPRTASVQVGNLARIGFDSLEVVEQIFQTEIDQLFCDLHNGRFAVQQRAKDGNTPLNSYRYTVLVLQEKIEGNNKKTLNLIQAGLLDERETNEFQWASNGNYFCLLNKTKNSPDQGKIEFGTIQKKVEGDFASYKVEITKSTNHFYMSHAQWDPHGKYFVSMSDQWHSVMIWSAIGEQIFKDTITKIMDIQWRTQATHVLSEKEELKLSKNANTFIKQYELEDDKVLNKAKYEKEQKRNEMKEQFTKYLKDKAKKYEDAKQQRIALLGFDEQQQDLVTEKIILKEEIIK